MTRVIFELPPHVANQIAAGEVVERPSSVVKELVENSIDAGATRVTVRIAGAGKQRIEVDDDGCGMSREDAEAALKRHATSKIRDADDLHHIASHGFRGEALPSVASVSRFKLHTCESGSNEGSEVSVDGMGRITVKPAAPRAGTRVEVCDLFLNTPARLRFMRTDRTEEAQIVESMRALALANPSVGFTLEFDGRNRLDLSAGQGRATRIRQIMGDEFVSNACECALEHEGVEVSGFFGLPTYHHRDAGRMLFMINGRVVRDKQLIAALNAGYRDVMFHDRYPVAVVFIEMDPAEVDVNVHPAKREVRFRSPQSVRSAVVACVRKAIESMGQTVSSQPGQQAIASMQGSPRPSFGGAPGYRPPASSGGYTPPDRAHGGSSGRPSDAVMRSLFSAPSAHESEASYGAGDEFDLGHAIAQVHRCYIVAQTDEGIVIVDQHAAHERINYEKLKSQLAKGSIASQQLLVPASLTVSAKSAAWLHDHPDALRPFGVELDAAGEEQFSIRAVPAMLREESPSELVAELVETCMNIGVEAEGKGRVLERWLGNRACKGSIKSGHLLKHEEQEALLRTMESTPNIAQCNHGRPTYVRLSLNDLDRLFGRKE